MPASAMPKLAYLLSRVVWDATVSRVNPKLPIQAPSVKLEPAVSCGESALTPRQVRLA